MKILVVLFAMIVFFEKLLLLFLFLFFFFALNPVHPLFKSNPLFSENPLIVSLKFQNPKPWGGRMGRGAGFKL